ncbi:MAG: ABC-F family ATP-binding cassette domain-containing protein [Pseudomonadota bacterium]
MSALVADQLSFGWSPDSLLFENLSFAIGRERVGLLGENGTGKSTLIKLLTGELSPGGGSVSRSEKLLYLPQLASPSLSIAEALGVDQELEALRRLESGDSTDADYALIGDDWDIEDRARKALDEVSVPQRRWSDLLSTLSGGQAMRVRLARARLEKPDLLILDEPTNDLDAAGLDSLYHLVETWTSGLLVVSHDRTLLSKVDRILEFSTLGLKSYGGPYAVYKDAKTTELQAAERRLANSEKQLKTARRAAQARKERDDRRAKHGKQSKTGSLPKMVIDGMKRRAQATAGRTQQLGEREIATATSDRDAARQDIEIREQLAFDVPSSGLPAKKRVLDVEGLTVRYDTAGAPVLQDFSLQLVGPARLAVSGRNGAGKSTLLKAISGLVPIESGIIRVGVDRHAYLRQDALDLDLDVRLVDYFLACNPEQTPNDARAALARFGFRNIAADGPVAQLSGGERLRAALATVLMSGQPPQLLILDEPTNHMDLDSIETLERALTAYDGALIVASHDGYFLDAIGIEQTLQL